MKRLLEAAGVDYHQWRALLRAYALIDYAALLGAYGPREARRSALQLAAFVAMATGTGFILAFIVWAARDPFLAAAIVTATMMLWAGVMVLSQSAALLTPEDHAIVGSRPVSSRTYFAVRVSAILLHTAENTFLLGWIPVVAFLTRADGSALLALAAAAAIAGSAAWVVAAVIAMYGWLLRSISPAQLSRIAMLAGGVASVALGAGVMLAIHRLTDSEEAAAMFNAVIPRDLRTLWFPGSWFAAYVPAAAGERTAAVFGAGAVSVVSLAALLVLLRGRMSAEYVMRLAELEVLARPHAPPRVKQWGLLAGEARAVALLVASHVRGDTRFQLAMSSSIVMAVLMTLMASSFRLPVDPFTATAAERAGDVMMPMFALLFVPMQMYQGLVLSPAHEASWLFFATPADRVKLVTGGRDAVAAFVLLPAVGALAILYLYAYGHAGHALLQAALLGSIAYAALQLSVLLTPRLPFSVPMVSDRSRGFPFWSGMIVVFVGMPFLLILQLVAYRNPLSTAVAFLIVGSAIVALNVLTRYRLGRQASALVYL